MSVATVLAPLDAARVSLSLCVKRLDHGVHLPLPTYATPGSAGMDLMAALKESLMLEPLGRVLVPTGLAFSIPKGFEGQVRSRSGLSIKHGVCVLNSPGTIDSDYRGEVKVVLINQGQEAFEVMPGMRVAQLVIAPVVQVGLKEVEELDEEGERQTNGFGSTGL